MSQFCTSVDIQLNFFFESFVTLFFACGRHVVMNLTVGAIHDARYTVRRVYERGVPSIQPDGTGFVLQNSTVLMFPNTFSDARTHPHDKLVKLMPAHVQCVPYITRLQQGLAIAPVFEISIVLCFHGSTHSMIRICLTDKSGPKMTKVKLEPDSR